MSREKSLAKNTMILALGTFIPKISAFITLPILTAYLSKADYGTYDLVLILTSLILPSATLQIQTAAFRFLIKSRNDPERKKTIITNIFVFTIPISIVAIVIMYFFLGNLSFFNRFLILLFFFVDMINNSCLQTVRGLGDNFSYSVGAILGSLSKILLTVLGILLFKEGLSAAIIALIVAAAFSSLFIVIKSRLFQCVDLKKVSWSEIKQLISYSWPMVPNSMSMWVMNVSDRLVITFAMGLEATAIYAVANKIPQILSIAQSTFTMAWQENASLTSDDKDVGEYYTKMFDLILDIMTGFLAAIIAATPILFIILIHGDYQDSYPQLPILFLAFLFSTMASFLGGIYVAFMKTKSVGLTTLAAAAINLIVDLLLVSLIGITAASLSTLISYFALVVFRMINVRKFVKIKYNYKKIVVYLAILILMCVVCFFRNPYLNIVNFVVGMVMFVILNRKLLAVIFRKIFKKKQKMEK